MESHLFNRSRRRRGMWFGLALMAMSWIVTASAQERARSAGVSGRLHITQLHHRAFTAADGAPLRVSDMAQDHEGYLWMTSQNGLYRFDGVRFDRSLGRRLPSQMVKGILVDTDGSLWLGYYFGGVSHVVGDRIQTYRQGLPGGTVFAFARMADGTLWMASTGGLARWIHGSWHSVGAEAGYDGSGLRDMSQSKDGRLWITTARGDHFVWQPASGRFEPVDEATALMQLWGIPPTVDKSLLNLVSTPFVDSAGALWLPSPRGIQRYRWTDGPDKAPVKEDFGVADGLSDVTPNTFFEDRDANVWVATALGIDQFRQSRITPHEVDEDVFTPAIAFDADGVAWVGTTWGSFRLTPASTRFPELGQYFSCVARDRLGNVWMAGQSGLFHIVHGQVSKLTGPVTDPSTVTRYQSITVDGEGTTWVAISGRALYRRDGEAWSEVDRLGGWPTDHLTRIVGDARGRLWVAFADGRLARMDKTALTRFDKSSGLDVGAIADMALDRANVLLGGESGLTQAVHDRFFPVLGKGGHVFAGISGVVQLRSGEVWLQADEGIVRIPADDMRRIANRPNDQVGYEVFDADDGLIGKADKVRPLPSLAEGRDDRVWITTTREVASIDTRHVIRNRRIATPTVFTVIADGVPHDASGDLTFPPHTRGIRLEFGAPALTMPSRTTYRARLVGVDDRWQELGTRRDVSYTNLSPGDYPFELQVTNEDGVSSAMARPLILHLLPAFYQKAWFRLLGVLAVGLVLAWLYRWRLAVVDQKARIRLDERERIARELHDTLLQGAQGLLFAVESAIRGSPLDDTARPGLERALARAREVIVEARAQVSELRLGSRDAECPLESYLEHLEDSGEGDRYATSIKGRMRRLTVDGGREVVTIVREALYNAVRHAEATNITLDIRYGRLRFVVAIEDDGKGIPRGTLATRRREGHWGITGMQERAARLGGKLRVVSRPGCGTTVRLTIPSRHIYRRHG